jgi:hypothetical protein
MANWIVPRVLATPSYKKKELVSIPRKWLEGEESQYHSHSPFLLRIKYLGSAFPRIFLGRKGDEETPKSF